MRTYVAIPFLFVFLFNHLAGAAGLCQDLFSPTETAPVQTELAAAVATSVAEVKPEIKIPVKTDSLRTEMYTVGSEGAKSRLYVQQAELSKDPEVAVLELMRLLVTGNAYALEDKNVLIKNKMSLGIPLKDGYTFLVNYESKSSYAARFVIEDKIVLLSPTNKEIKLTDAIIDPVEMKIAKKEFDMPEFFDKDAVITLKVPLSIDAKVLAKLDKYSVLFEHMSKDELRKILEIKSPLKRKTLLQLARVKSMFKKEILKQPFKIFLHSLIMGGMMFGINQISTTTKNPDAFHILAKQPAAIVEMATTKASFTASEALAKAQYQSLLKEVEQRTSSSAMTAGSAAAAAPRTAHAVELIKAGGTSFTLNASSFIFEQVDPVNGSVHTYLVIAEDKGAVQKAGLQYIAIEINAAKYAPMIKAIKDHQKID